MITKIVLALNTYKPEVPAIAFGSATIPPAPYAVVKQENHPKGTGFRIIAHFLKGQQTFLEDYIIGDVGVALKLFSSADRHGNMNRLFQDFRGQSPSLVIDNDDKTISMERLYWMPDQMYS